MIYFWIPGAQHISLRISWGGRAQWQFLYPTFRFHPDANWLTAAVLGTFVCFNSMDSVNSR